MGGNLAVRSRLQEGSCFSLKLPVSQVEYAGVETTQDTTPLRGKRILLAEDNQVNREIALGMLEKIGCKVTAVENGQEAISALKAESFDLVLMDCQMPVMDGFEAAEHIARARRSAAIAPVPVVALTANALKGDKERCLDSGMDDYLSKPVRRAELEAMLVKWLHRNAVQQSRTHQPGIVPALPEGVDARGFEQAQATLGAKWPLVLGYFLEDGAHFLAQIEQRLLADDPLGVRLPAHTLKTASQQFGMIRLAGLAEEMERLAQRVEEGAKMRQLLGPLQQEFRRLQPMLQAIA